MLKSVEYKGYVIHGVAEPWYGPLWISGYVITTQRNGERIREYREVALRDTADEACDAAIISGLQYADLTLPDIA